MIEGGDSRAKKRGLGVFFTVSTVVLLTYGCLERQPHAPVVSAIEPELIVQGQTVPVTIYGEFYLDTRVSYRQKSRSRAETGFSVRLNPVALEAVSCDSFNRLTAVVPAELSPGTYTLTVIDPAGRVGTLDDAFIVIEAGGLVGGGCLRDDECVDSCRSSLGCVRGTCTFSAMNRDRDADGYVDAACAGDDCDDDPSACGAGCYPGNGDPDICDGYDQDCDGELDEDPGLLWYHDADGDGYTNNSDTLARCTDPDGADTEWVSVATANDCADMPWMDPACENLDGSRCNPGLIELCDGADNDCDPATDDGVDDPLQGTVCDGPDADTCLDDTYIGCAGGGLVCSTGSDPCNDSCGNGACGSVEDSCTCPRDCGGSSCGDGICCAAVGEDGCTCLSDCGSTCGDGCCNGSETEKSCSTDCGPFCGSGQCWNTVEDACNCPADCTPDCGDGCCTGAETPAVCAEDCWSGCGDLVCDPTEDACTCTLDCVSVCGDGCCTGSETIANCPGDCLLVPACSDGIDNDLDGRVDGNDPGCSNSGDTDERCSGWQCPQCDDGNDNDWDGDVDYPDDANCSGPMDDSEWF